MTDMTSDSSMWDLPSLRVGGEYVKFEAVGDSIAGTITALRPVSFDDGQTVPQLLITTDQGEDRTVTAGPIRLKTELATQRPEVGDYISITLTELEARGGGRTLKHFDVQVRRAGQHPATSHAGSVTSQQPAQIGPDVEKVLGSLTPQQRAALGLPNF